MGARKHGIGAPEGVGGPDHADDRTYPHVGTERAAALWHPSKRQANGVERVT